MSWRIRLSLQSSSSSSRLWSGVLSPLAPLLLFTLTSPPSAPPLPSFLPFMFFSSATRSVWWPGLPPRRPAAPRRPATRCPAGSPPASREGCSRSLTPSSTSGPSMSCHSRAPWTLKSPLLLQLLPTHHHGNQSHHYHHQPLLIAKRGKHENPQ